MGEERKRSVIEVLELEKSFKSGGEEVVAVNEVSFSVPEGSVVGVLGPNGAGKTTMIKSMLGVIRPDGGAVRIAGFSTLDDQTDVYRRTGAVLEGARNVYWRLTVRENLKFFAGLGDQEPKELGDRHESLLDRFDLTDYADTPVRELSRGMKQKVSLATTLARDVSVIFMDEPTLGLDIQASAELRDELGRLADDEDVTIMISSHDMDVVEEVCDRVLVLNDGNIIRYTQVDELKPSFQSVEYRISVESHLGSEVVRSLRQVADVTIEQEDDRVVVSFYDHDGSQLTGIIDVIREHRQSISEVQNVKPDLENTFLELVNQETDGLRRPISGDPQ